MGLFLENKKNLSYLGFILFLLFIIIGFRDSSVGTDTLSYIVDFKHYAKFSLPEMWNYAWKWKEPMYVIISWIPSIFSTSYTGFLLVWALFPVVSLYVTLKRELENPKDYVIALIAFFILGFFAFYVTGIRQTASLSLILLGYQYLKRIRKDRIKDILLNRNLLLFLLLLSTAYLIHNSSIIFLIALPFLFVKVGWWYLILVVGLFSIDKMVGMEQLTVLSALIFEDRFSTYGTTYESSQNLSAFIMQLILFLICFVNKNKLMLQDCDNIFLINLVFLGLVFQSMSEMMAEMARISFFFGMFYLILLPRLFKLIPKPISNLSYFTFVIVGIIYLFCLSSSNLPVYKFA